MQLILLWMSRTSVLNKWNHIFLNPLSIFVSISFQKEPFTGLLPNNCFEKLWSLNQNTFKIINLFISKVAGCCLNVNFSCQFITFFRIASNVLVTSKIFIWWNLYLRASVALKRACYYTEKIFWWQYSYIFIIQHLFGWNKCAISVH